MAERLHEKRPDLYPKPQTFYISSACYSDNTKRMLEELHERIDRGREAAINSLKCEWHIDSSGLQSDIVRYSMNDVLASYDVDIFPNIEAFNKTKNEKEKEKMEAKKCERCGKLYEIQDANPYIPVYFPGLPVSDWNKENYSESRIRKDNTKLISVDLRGGEVVDLCPECREKLKDFFESGKDETTVIKKAEE